MNEEFELGKDSLKEELENVQELDRKTDKEFSDAEEMQSDNLDNESSPKQTVQKTLNKVESRQQDAQATLQKMAEHPSFDEIMDEDFRQDLRDIGYGDKIHQLEQLDRFHKDLHGDMILSVQMLGARTIQLMDLVNEQKLRHDDSRLINNLQRINNTTEDSVKEIAESFRETNRMMKNSFERRLDKMEDRSERAVRERAAIAKSQQAIAELLPPLLKDKNSVMADNLADEVREHGENLEDVPDEEEQEELLTPREIKHALKELNPGETKVFWAIYEVLNDEKNDIERIGDVPNQMIYENADIAESSVEAYKSNVKQTGVFPD